MKDRDEYTETASRGGANVQTDGLLWRSGPSLHTVFEAIPDAVLVHDEEGRILYANQVAAEQLGWTAAELVGRNLRRVVTPESAARIAQHVAEVFANGSCGFQTTYVSRHGRLIEAEVRGSAIDFADKRAILAVACEVGERNRLEGELAQSQESFRRLLDEAPVGYHQVDADGRIVWVNRTELDMLGYSQREMMGRPVWDFAVHRESCRGEFVAKISGLVRPGRAFERTYRRKDGIGLPVLIEDRLLTDNDGRITGFRSTMLDITPRKALEEQLRQSQKMEAIGQLAGGIVHDFSNLLTAILGYAELGLREAVAETPLGEYLFQIRDAAQRAADLTRQLMTFSRRQAGRLQVFDLNGRVEKLSKMLQHLIEEHVELEMSLSETPLSIEANPAQIEQVLMNLAINARDAMPDGGLLQIETAAVELDEDYARAHHRLKQGRYAMLAVTDTGVGMTRELRQRIFDPFFTTKDEGKGTGLGLSTAYGIVQQHGGAIHCYSEPGKGATFRVYLPLVGAQEAAATRDREPDPDCCGDESVLIVEDEEHVRNLAARAFRDAGYSVQCVADGSEAIALLGERTHPIDLLVTDLVMPKLNGPEVAQEIRSMYPSVKLLFMSGYAGDTAGRLRRSMPDVPILQKPFTARALVRKAREVLDGG